MFVIAVHRFHLFLLGVNIAAVMVVVLLRRDAVIAFLRLRGG